MCVEAFFLFNLLMDFCILFAVSRSMGCFRFRRIWLASSIGAGYAVAAKMQPALSGPMTQFIMLIPFSALVAGPAPWRMHLSASLSLPVTALATGACAEKMGLACFTLPLLLLPLALTAGTRFRRSVLMTQPVNIEVRHHGRVMRFAACVDTGNRLSEPFSGQPVLIASAHLLRHVLPSSGYRLVPYDSVGGDGTLRCFRPDRLYILTNGHRRPAPQSWIAIYPGRLPGPFQALAPAAFAIT